MRRTTVKIPEQLDARLRHEAARRGMTISAITREALEAHLDGTLDSSEAPNGKRRHRRLAGAGAFRSGEGDLSVRIEEILRDELGRRP
jgi:predicted DNA-binding protein